MARGRSWTLSEDLQIAAAHAEAVQLRFDDSVKAHPLRDSQVRSYIRPDLKALSARLGRSYGAVRARSSRIGGAAFLMRAAREYGEARGRADSERQQAFGWDSGDAGEL